MDSTELKLGQYKHYKGGLYKVLSIAKHSETLEDMVIYEALYENEVSKVWVRPLKMFTEKVIVNGMRIPRFKYVGK